MPKKCRNKSCSTELRWNPSSDSSPKVFSPSVYFHDGQQHEDPECLPESLTPTGVLNLVTSSSALRLRVLFRTRSTHGVIPFKAFLLSCSRIPSPATLPSCRWLTSVSLSLLPCCIVASSENAATKPQETKSPFANPTFRVLLHTKVCHLHWRFRPPQAHSSLGASPLQGFLPHLKRHDFHHASPHAIFKNDASTIIASLQGVHSK